MHAALLTRLSEYFGSDDKENAQAQAELPNPKKRVKAAPTADAKPARPASRKGAPATVLSPKSHNSQAVSRPPSRPLGHQKTSSFEIRPSSPMKPTFTQTTSRPTSKASSRAPSRQATSRQMTKRPAAPRAAFLSSEGMDSEASSASAGTTIVTGSQKTAPTRKAPAAKAATAASTKRTAAVKKEPAAPAPAAGGRTLRKRG